MVLNIQHHAFSSYINGEEMAKDEVPLRGKNMTAKATAQVDIDPEIQEAFDRLAAKTKKLRKKNNDSKADIATLKAIRDMAVQMMPIAFSQYKTWKNDRSMMALKGLIDQVKDAMLSLRIQEKGERECDHIINQIILPDFQAHLKQYLNNQNVLKSHISFLSPKDRKKVIAIIDSQSAQTGQYYNGMNAMLSDKIREYLVGKR